MRNEAKTARSPAQVALESLGKVALHELSDRLLAGDSMALADCVAFVEADTLGYGHGRARARMCRRLKHCTLSSAQKNRLVECIMARLRSGDFSEQFRDQLRLAIHLDPKRVNTLAEACKDVPIAHVRRFADWTLARLTDHRATV